MRIPVCLSSDKHYVQHLSVTMASILANKAPTETLVFYILESGFTEKDYQTINALKGIHDFEVHYFPVQHKILEVFPISKKDLVTIATYFRLFIPELIPHEDRIIYLDCDIVVRHALGELYNMDFRDNYLLGVRDIDSRGNNRRMKTKRYVNAGVLLMNCKKMRQDDIYQRFIDFILTEKERIQWHDQDVIAATLDGHVGYIDSKWNGQIGRLPKDMRFSRLNETYILHYIGATKPWLPYQDAHFIEEYFKYLRLTPFANYEADYRQKRSYWRCWQYLKAMGACVFSKKTSPLRTYNTFRFLGIPIRCKRKQRRKQ